MDYYKILGVACDCEREVLDAAYRALMRKYHPDTWPGDNAEAERRAKTINEAYEVLRDPKRRRDYDQRRSSHDADPRQPEQKPRNRGPSAQKSSVPSSAESTDRPSLGCFVATGIGILTIGALIFVGPANTPPAPTEPNLNEQPQQQVTADGKTRVFCIGNNTLRAVSFSVEWPGQAPATFELRPGYSQVYTYQGAADYAVVRFVDFSADEVRVKPRATVDDTSSCEPKYTFQFKDAPTPGYLRSPFDRYGLYQEGE